jgi:4-hydroxy-tetrahydrodipicolinate synthase
MILEGVHVPLVTPFDEQGELDADACAQLIDHCLAAGVHGFVVAGTTGEYYALTERERLRLFEVARDAVDGRAQLIAGCNAGSTREVVHYGGRARELGFHGLLLSCPHTSLPTQTELIAHFSTVAEEVGLPIVIYNFPARAGDEIGLDAVEALAAVPEIVGIKEASGDFTRFLAMWRRLRDRIEISCGSDDQALDYFRWGVTSWIGGTANVLPRQHVELLAAARRGEWEEAERLMAALLPWIQNMESGRYNQKAKLGLELQGIRVGNVRRPLLPLAPDEEAEYRAVLTAVIATSSIPAAHSA